MACCRGLLFVVWYFWNGIWYEAIYKIGVQNDAVASRRSTEQTREGSDSNPVRGPLILFEALGSHMGSL